MPYTKRSGSVLSDMVKDKILASFYESFYKYMNGESGDRSKEVHVTDLCSLCLRATYYNKKYGMPFDLKSAMRMAIGQKLHEVPIFGDEGLHETPVAWNGIVGRVDEYYNGSIIDKKTTRNIPKGPSEYVTNQIRYYRVMMTHGGHEVKAGYVIYFDVAGAFAEIYPCDVMSDPLDVIENEMMDKLAALTEALKKQYPPDRNMGWWCRTCMQASRCFGPNVPGLGMDESEAGGGWE